MQLARRGSPGDADDDDDAGEGGGLVAVPDAYVWVEFLRHEHWDHWTLCKQPDNTVYLRWTIFKLQMAWGMLDRT